MGEKKDSGSKDADNFGAEFGTDQLAAQRQAAAKRNQAAQRSRSRAGDDRATGTSRGTVPTGGTAAPATLTATSNTTPPGESGVSTDLDLIMAGYIPRFVPNVKPPSVSVPEAERLLLAQQNLASVQDDDAMIFDEDDLRGDLFLNPSLPQDPKNFGDEFGGNIRPRLTSTNVAPGVADVRMQLNKFNQNQGSGIASLPSVSPTSRPTRAPSDTDLFNFGSEFGMFTDPLAASSVMLDTRNALNQGNNETTEDLGFEDVDDDDSFFPVTNEPQDITALNPNFLSRLPLVGDALYQGQMNQLQQFASIPGSKYDYSTGGGSAQVGQGTLTLSPSGIVTYDGPKDASYTGPFANLVNPTERPEKDAGDPCPPGFQLIGGVCQPMFDVAGPAAPPTPGSNFQMTPTAGFPTSFAPMTQATPVSLPDPFVLSPTGAAIGRRV